MKFKLPSVTLANYGTAIPGKYGQIKKLQIVFTGRYEPYSTLFSQKERKEKSGSLYYVGK